MLDAKDAVRTAIAYFVEVTGASRAQDILVEEVEPVDDEGGGHWYWMVTLSVPAPVLNPMSFSDKTLRQPRDYKLLKIDAIDGSVRSMKIRQIDAA
jgi:hypothetical protein